MQLSKYTYVQKCLTHDIYEARALTGAAKRYKVVTQMGNQGASGDGVRQFQEQYYANVIGEIYTVYCWTDRSVQPQNITQSAPSRGGPSGLDWDLWLDTAPTQPYVNKLVPFNWRGSDLSRPKATSTGVDYPGRGIELLWDPQQLRVTNFDEVNRFVKRVYRPGWPQTGTTTLLDVF